MEDFGQALNYAEGNRASRLSFSPRTAPKPRSLWRISSTNALEGNVGKDFYQGGIGS